MDVGKRVSFSRSIVWAIGREEEKLKEGVEYICETTCERYANLTGILREKLKNVILMVQRYFMKGHWYILNGRQII